MVMRITGMSSGLDIDSIVTDSLKPYRLKIQAQQQQKQILEWKQTQYQSIMKKANSFYSKYLDVANANGLYTNKAYNQTKFTSSDDSVVTVTGSNNATIDNYKVSVTQLAAKASDTLKSDDLKSYEGTANAKLSVNYGDGTFEFEVTDDTGKLLSNDKIISNFNAEVSKKKSEYNSVISEDKRLQGILSEDKRLKDIITEHDKLQAIVDAGDDSTEEKKLELEEAKTKLNDETYKKTIQDTTDKLENEDYKKQLEDANNALNQVDYKDKLDNAKAGVNSVDISLKYSQFSKGLVFTGKEEGKGSFTIEDSDGNKIIDATSKKLIAEITNGKGEKYPITDSDKNSVTLDGVTFNFKDVGDSKITGEQDVTELKNKIVSFIKDYNELLGEINGRIWENYDGDYLPLTDDQREAMSDKQIEQWETKAQTGLLRKDDDLRTLSDNMKNIMSTLIGSTGIDLERIGIKPVNDYKEKNGTFEIDEDKLTEALKNNFDGIKELFMKEPDSTGKNGGILSQMNKLMKDNFVSFDAVFKEKASSDGVYALTSEISKQLSEKKTLIEEMNDALKDREDTLYKKYSALETALAKAQSQQSSMSSWFGTGN